jgi:hypothetical protein
MAADELLFLTLNKSHAEVGVESAVFADGGEFGDAFRLGDELQDVWESVSAEVGVESGDNDCFGVLVGPVLADRDEVVEELPFINPNYVVFKRELFGMFELVESHRANGESIVRVDIVGGVSGIAVECDDEASFAG